LEIPFVFDNFAQAKEFCEKGGLDIIAKEAASSNIKPLYAIPFASHAGIFKKPVRTIADLKGMKLRSPAQPHIDWLGTMGAANVSVAVGEVYQALQFGTIDGVISTAESILQRKWYETVGYFLDNRFGMGVHLVAINLKRWNSLPDDIKKIMLEVSKWEQDKLFASAEASDKEVRAQLRKNIKNTYTLPPAEIAKWQEKAETIWAKWANQGPIHQEALNLAKKITKNK
jgi:TRAP-type C4-dicarboxylate transport system substrate-binding protein